MKTTFLKHVDLEINFANGDRVIAESMAIVKESIKFLGRSSL